MIKQVMSLAMAMASPNHPVNIVSIKAKRGLQRRLFELGITPGVSAIVMNGHGPVIISLRGTKLALGHGVAQKIMVEEV